MPRSYIPKLKKSNRSREFNSYSFDKKAEIVKSWLFDKTRGHRELDKDILELDPAQSLGYQSMGVLHYLGLTKEFKGIFSEIDQDKALIDLRNDRQDFSEVISFLENNDSEIVKVSDEKLVQIGKKRDTYFERNYIKRLNELDGTDIGKLNSSARREQSLLRTIILKGKEEAECALCGKFLPSRLIVAAHIKPRSECSLKERTDINVVMPVCKIGCDDLFEKGYIWVNNLGVIETENHNKSDLGLVLKEYEGRTCKYFKQESKEYFKFRNELNFR